MTFPLISALAAAAILILQQCLMLTVGMHRFKTGRGAGFGDDIALERKARRHGNLAESSAIFLLVLALTEMSGASLLAIKIFAAVFVIGRIFHALGFTSNKGSHAKPDNNLFQVFRALGAFATSLGGIALGAYFLLTLTTFV